MNSPEITDKYYVKELYFSYFLKDFFVKKRDMNKSSDSVPWTINELIDQFVDDLTNSESYKVATKYSKKV